MIGVAIGVAILGGAVMLFWGSNRPNFAKSFSAIGTVSSTTSETLFIEGAKNSDGSESATYAFSLSSKPKVETNTYASSTLAQIRLGDRVIVQGTSLSGKVTILRIIIFPSVADK